MATYEIDKERSTFSLRFSPSFPGMGAKISGLTGRFDAAVDHDGTIDWDAPFSGAFEMHVDDISLGNRFMTFGARQWLDPRQYDRVTGELLDVEPEGTDGFTSHVRINVKGTEVTMAATGRFDVRTHDDITVHGRSMADPREFGVALPPFLNVMVHVRWRIELNPVP
ncbi:MAG: hypothetical protein R2699_14930 [Acidimicrobiales bacterium]|nr:YceI family protein [Acidimicrobiales bacterium]